MTWQPPAGPGNAGPGHGQYPGGQQYPPQSSQPQYQQPQYAQPQYGQPQYQQPQYQQAQYAQPQYGPPQPGLPTPSGGSAKVIMIVLAVVGVLVIGGGTAIYLATNGSGSLSTALGGKSDEDKVREVYEGYGNDLARGDWQAAIARVCTDARQTRLTLQAMSSVLQGMGVGNSTGDLRVVVNSVQVHGDTADVRANIDMAGVDMGEMPGTAQRQGDSWCLLS